MGEIYTLGDLEKRVEEEESRIDDAEERIKDPEKPTEDTKKMPEEAEGNESRVNGAEERTKDFEELHGKIRKKPHKTNDQSSGKQPDLRQRHLEDYHKKEIQEALEPIKQENTEKQEHLSPELLDQLTAYWNQTQGKISFQDWMAQHKETRAQNRGNGKLPKELKREEAQQRKIKDFSRTGSRHPTRA